MLTLQERYPKLVAERRTLLDALPPPNRSARLRRLPPPPPRPRRNPASSEPFTKAVYDAAQYVERRGSELHVHRLQARRSAGHADSACRQRGVAGRDRAARHILTVLSKGDTAFTEHGSGRLELAERIFSDCREPRGARDRQSRVGLALRPAARADAERFRRAGGEAVAPGTARRFVGALHRNGWSLKWLQQGNHAVGRLSAGEQAAGRRRCRRSAERARVADEPAAPRHRVISRFARCVRRACSTRRCTGCPRICRKRNFKRRTIYGRVSRSNTSKLLRLYDFPDANQTSPGRDLTTTSLQQLFVMNSAFMHSLGCGARRRGARRRDRTSRKVRNLYRRILSRDPTRGRTGRRAHVPDAGHGRAVCANSAVDQRGDFLAMNTSCTSRRACNDSVAVRRLGSVGLAGLLGEFASRTQRQARGQVGTLHRAGAAAQSEARHLSVHGRRAVAARHVRSQAGAGEVGRPAAGRRRSAHRAIHRRPAAVAVQVLEVRPERHRGQRAASRSSDR